MLVNNSNAFYFCKVKLTTGILLTFILLLGYHTKAQNCNLSIRGKIIHLENNEPIEAAYIWVMEAKEGAVSDQNGNFTVKNLCSGTYTLTIQYLVVQGLRVLPLP